VAEVLEVLHLPDEHGVPQMDVWSGRIEPYLDGERTPESQLRPEGVSGQDIDAALRQEVESV
jgi:hypothetical protein